MKKIIILAAAASLIADVAVAGTKDVRFPSSYAKDFVLHHNLNKPNMKHGHTLRKFFINKAALAPPSPAKACRAAP